MKRRFLGMRSADLLTGAGCLSCLVFLIVLNYQLSANHLKHERTEEHIISPVGGAGNLELSGNKLLGAAHEEKESVHRRSRRSTSWAIPNDFPVVLKTPVAGCDDETILTTEFPNATCFAECNTGATCTAGGVTDITNGDASLVCSARIVQLGFKRTGSSTISRWISANSNVVNKNALLLDADGLPICPSGLADSSAGYHFDTYTVDMAGSADQTNLYLYCEECLTGSSADHYFNSTFVDLSTVLFTYLSSTEYRFIVTMKNPTDRAIAEYFYPYIANDTDLSTVGTTVLHTAMSNAVTQAKECMNSFGPTACVFGFTDGQTFYDETQMLFDGCYTIHLTQALTQIDMSQTYFVKYEEYSADAETEMRSLFSFIGLDYEGPPNFSPGTSVQKPLLTATVDMLDAFYEPFNTDLVTLLGDNKWQFTR